jgi:short-subunit dehydrogenase
LESIRFHLIRHGIAITVINPGFVKTPLTDKNDFKMPFLVDPEESARIVCDGLERCKRDISYPWQMNLIVKFGRLLPAPMYESIVNRLW